MDLIVYEINGMVFLITPASDLESAKKAVPEGVAFKVVNVVDIPKDKTFRDAWDYDLKVDITKAKEIWKNKLREERASLFDANDILLRDAIAEEDSKKKAIALKERDRLRDITLLVDECETPEEIKKITL